MITQTSYPVFESGQVLTSGQLNNLTEYLEQQDRRTRSRLVGIGVACGLRPTWNGAEGEIRLSPGCAVTSEGFLIVEAERFLDRYRSYEVPVPELEEAPDETEGPYPFFVDDDDDPIDLWELLSRDDAPAPGDPPATDLDAEFLRGKVMLLFLESDLESLKSCDINDCSDKGMERSFTLRRLLATRESARAMLEREQDFASQPVERSEHRRYGLEELRIEKIHPAAHGIRSFWDLMNRVLEIAAGLQPRLEKALHDSYDVYDYLFGDLYEADPFDATGYFQAVPARFLTSPLTVQYLYDYLFDVVQSHNEFLRAAMRLEAECCPDERRFPRHVLLGEPGEARRAAGADHATAGAAAGADPLAVNAGAGARQRPEPLRHHFVPSPLHGGERERLDRVRALHYRTYLLAHRFRAKGLLEEEIRITPSVDGHAPLSDRALPFYYAFDDEDDLHLNWSWERTTGARLEQVHSHRLVGSGAHPLLSRMDDHDFYRVEGIVGKSLRTALLQLLKQKRELGLSFGIEPVYLDLSLEGGDTVAVLDRVSRKGAMEGLEELLVCRLRNLDALFLLLMAALFRLLTFLIATLSKLSTRRLAAGKGTMEAEQPPGGGDEPPSGGEGGGGRLFPLDARVVSELRVREVIEGLQPSTEEERMVGVEETERLLREYRPRRYERGMLTLRLTPEDQETTDSLTRLYTATSKKRGKVDLYEASRTFADKELTLDEGVSAPEAAGRIHSALNLVDRAEGLVDVISAPTLARFDFQEFGVRYDSFVEAYRGYLAETADTSDVEVAKTNKILANAFGRLGSGSFRAVLRGLAGEFQERLEAEIGKLTLSGYAPERPGLEHRAGVPRGGTLVLLYTHRDFLARLWSKERERVAAQLSKNLGRVGLETEQILQLLGDLPRAETGGQPLDQLMVVGDFCLPHLCCDTDCSDIDLEVQDVGRPRNVTVSGTVLRRFSRGGELTTPSLAEDATMWVKNLETGREVEVEWEHGTFAFTGAPGIYEVTTEVPRVGSDTRTVTVGEGEAHALDIVVKQPTQ